MTVAIATEISVADAIRMTRLRHLRRVAGDAPEVRLYMGTWTGTSACGTTRCLAGWAVSDPWMRENTPILDLFCIVGGNLYPLAPRRIYHELGTVFRIKARDSRRMFGLTNPHSEELYTGTHITKAMVLNNIDRLLAGLPAMGYDRMIAEGQWCPTYPGDDLMPRAERHRRFIETFQDHERFRTEYRGRFSYVGPALIIEGRDLQDVIRMSNVRLLWDSLGKTGLVVYPA